MPGAIPISRTTAGLARIARMCAALKQLTPQDYEEKAAKTRAGTARKPAESEPVAA